MTIALVSGQTASNNTASSVATLAVTLPNNPATNNLVVVGCATGTGTAFTCVDGNSNSYTATADTPVTISQSGLNWKAGIFYLIAPANANKVITVSWTTATFVGLWAAEFSGAAISGVLDVENTGQQPTVTVVTLPSVTPAGDNELFFATVLTANAITVASPFTQIGSKFNGQTISQFFIQGAAAAVTPNDTAASGSAGAIMAAFKPLAGDILMPMICM